MAAQPLTYALAMAAGRDLADRRMRAAGRSRWNLADTRAAMRETHRLSLAAGLITREQFAELTGGRLRPLRE